MSGARVVSLDAFRGLAIAGMLLVNDPGSWSYVYRPLDHAEWNGWTPTDLIFPFFVFVVGASLTLSTGSWRVIGSSSAIGTVSGPRNFAASWRVRGYALF